MASAAAVEVEARAQPVVYAFHFIEVIETDIEITFFIPFEVRQRASGPGVSTAHARIALGECACAREHECACT